MITYKYVSYPSMLQTYIFEKKKQLNLTVKNFDDL